MYASPVAADGRIYVVGREGAAVVLEAGPQLKVLATNRLDDACDEPDAERLVLVKGRNRIGDELDLRRIECGRRGLLTALSTVGTADVARLGQDSPALESRAPRIGATRAIEDGIVGEARGRLAPDGPMFVKGALWRGRTDGEPIEPGTPVRVRGVDGLILRVEAETPHPVGSPGP